MRMMVSAALGAAALTLVGAISIMPAASAEKSAAVQQGDATKASAIEEFSSQRRRWRRYGYYGPRYYRPYGYRPYGYYGRPYYRPYGYYGGPRFYGPGFGFSFGF